MEGDKMESHEDFKKNIDEDLYEDDHFDDGELGKTRLKLAHHDAIVSFSSQDLRILSNTGQLVCRLEPSSIIEGVKAYSVSLFQVMKNQLYVQYYA